MPLPSPVKDFTTTLSMGTARNPAKKTASSTKISLISLFFLMALSSSADLSPCLQLSCEQGVDIIPLDLKLVQDEFLHKIVLRSLDDLLRSSELRDLSVVNDHDSVGKRQRFLRIMGNDD